MKTLTQLKWLVAAFFILVNTQSTFAQTRSDIFDHKVTVTWLGMDFTKAVYLGKEDTIKAKGGITNEEIVSRYIPAWAGLFLSEPKTYNPARSIHRDSVKFAFEVTEAVNKKINKNFFADKLDATNTVNFEDIVKLVNNYDFQGHKGIGMMLFVTDFDKYNKKAGGWLTFVNMQDKTVLLTIYRSGDSRGFGFRNYWAHSWFNILRDFSDDFSSLKKEKK